MSDLHNRISLSNIKPIEFCGKIILYRADLNLYITPFEIKPTTGEHDFNTCSDCSTMLAEIISRLKNRFEGVGSLNKFPYCCNYHKNLISHTEFHISDFLSVPEMVAKKIIYTNQHIINNYNSENWLKNITDYIDWAIDSFGHMPSNCGEPLYLSDYFSYVTHLLNQRTEIPIEKKKQILDHLNLYQIPDNKSKTDINIILDTYQRWLKIFPFDLNSYFGNLKEIFENHVPLFSNKGEVNIHSGKVKAKFHTKKTLFEDLIKVTDDLLTRTNGKALYENGIITDTNRIKLELINGKRKLKLTQGYQNNSPDEEHRYRKMIKDWFKDEKDYFNEISPLLKPTQPKNMSASINPFQYMEFRKSSFCSNLIEENKFTLEETDELYQVIIDTIKQLEKIRSDELKSHNLIIERAKGLDKNTHFDRISRMYLSWLVKALANDDSYVYSYNYLAQLMNSRMRRKAYDVKFISDSDLYFILEKEKLSKNEVSTYNKSTKSNPTDFSVNSSQINYLEIILKGYFDSNSNDNLPNYFFREFKKAEKNLFDAEEFFNGCLKVVTDFENNLKNQLNDRTYQLKLLIKTVEEDEAILDCEKELKEIGMNNFSVLLSSVTNNLYMGHLWHKDILLIKNAINNAYQKSAPPLSSIIETKPAILPSTLKSLPPIENVYFVHYQCDHFDHGDKIFGLFTFDNIEVKIFDGDEAVAIERYCQKVTELNNRGLIPIHWNQNSPNFGVDHIKDRYTKLTGKQIFLEYPGSLNLADYLKFKYGENYAPHRRLDSLAKLNDFSGAFETDSKSRTYSRDRIMLLSKIYFNEMKGTLKIGSNISIKPSSVQGNQSTNSEVPYRESQLIPINNQYKYTLFDYKAKIDRSLSYYSKFITILNAILVNDFESLDTDVEELNEYSYHFLTNETLLIEQIHFDLNTEEASIYFNYGLSKINKLLDAFYHISKTLVVTYHDLNLNKTFHELWYILEANGAVSIKYSESSVGFISELVEEIEKSMLQFKEKFISSISLNAAIKINVPYYCVKEQNESGFSLKSIIEHYSSAKDNKSINNIISTPLNVNDFHTETNRISETIIDTHHKANVEKSAPSIPDLTDMKQITLQILAIFDRFDNYNFIIENGKSKIINLEEFSFSLYNQISIFEKQLMGLHLNGNESILSNVKKELLKKKDNLDGIDFGISLSIPGAENTKVIIDPESVKLVNQIKLKYITQLLRYIDDINKTTILPPDQTIFEKGSSKPQAKQFKEYFAGNLQKNLPDICKTIFNNHSSPKDFAIMLCLLTQKGLLTLQNRKRKEFYISWYNYIGKPLPKAKNFFPINKFIDDNSSNGFVFKDENDIDYNKFDTDFTKALKNNKIS